MGWYGRYSSRYPSFSKKPRDPNQKEWWKTKWLDEELSNACVSGNTTVIEQVIAKGADLDGKFGGALRSAAWGVRNDIIKLLLDKGADINICKDKVLDSIVCHDNVEGWDIVFPRITLTDEELSNRFAQSAKIFGFRVLRKLVEEAKARTGWQSILASGWRACLAQGWIGGCEFIVKNGYDIEANYDEHAINASVIAALDLRRSCSIKYALGFIPQEKHDGHLKTWFDYVVLTVQDGDLVLELSDLGAVPSCTDHLKNELAKLSRKRGSKKELKAVARAHAVRIEMGQNTEEKA